MVTVTPAARDKDVRVEVADCGGTVPPVLLPAAFADGEAEDSRWTWRIPFTYLAYTCAGLLLSWVSQAGSPVRRANSRRPGSVLPP